MATHKSSIPVYLCNPLRIRCSECLRVVIEASGQNWDEWSATASKKYLRQYYRANVTEAKRYQQEYRQANTIAVKRKRQAYYQRNIERFKKRQREYQQVNAERTKQRKRAYRQANAQQVRQRFNKWYQRNAERERQKARAYRQVNAEKIKQYHHEYYQTNMEKKKQREREFRQAHPEKTREYSKIRRARKLAAPINDFTAAQWQAMQEQYDHRCVYCGKRFKGKLSQDHLTPLIKGGSHTSSNIVPACRSCNSRKQAGPVLIPVQPVLLLGIGD
jgi:hypothetical protein